MTEQNRWHVVFDLTGINERPARFIRLTILADWEEQAESIAKMRLIDRLKSRSPDVELKLVGPRNIETHLFSNCSWYCRQLFDEIGENPFEFAYSHP